MIDKCTVFDIYVFPHSLPKVWLYIYIYFLFSFELKMRADTVLNTVFELQLHVYIIVIYIHTACIYNCYIYPHCMYI